MKKGFTLIELLAVILILGIIALIAIPTVNNIINESKKGAFKSTVSNLTTVLEERCQLEKMKDGSITRQYVMSSDGIYPKVDIKGQLPSKGIAYVNSECEVALSVSNDNYVMEKSFNTNDYETKNDAEVNMQIDKFYFAGTKKLYIYKTMVVTASELSDENKQDLKDSYGEELGTIMAEMSSMQSYTIYLDKDNNLLKSYAGYSFPKKTELAKINRFRELFKKMSSLEGVICDDDFIINTDDDIYVMFYDYTKQCTRCFEKSIPETINELKSAVEFYDGTETIIE